MMTSPLLPTRTSVPLGSLLASVIAIFTFSFSISVKLLISLTPVFSGRVISIWSAREGFLPSSDGSLPSSDGSSSSISGLDSGSLGSVPSESSIISSTPSLSSSVSVASGVPSPSVSLRIVTVVSLVVVLPSSFVAMIVAVCSLTSSPSFQSSDLSTVPSICLVSGLYVNPSGRPSTLTVAFGSSTSTITGGMG